MKEIFLSIAGFHIALRLAATEELYPVTILKDLILHYCKPFIVHKKPTKIHHTVTVTTAQTYSMILQKMKKQRFINFYQRISNLHTITFYHISIIQFQVVLRYALLHLLAENHGFFLHASAVRQGNVAHIFLGPSGAGKSTATKLSKSIFTPIADDTVIIKKERNMYYCYQTPFYEKEWELKRSTTRYQIGNIYILQKSTQTSIVPIVDSQQRVHHMLKQFWTEADYTRKQTPYAFDFIARFNRFYFLRFTLDKNHFVKALQAHTS
jgi:hypothetical protein